MGMLSCTINNVTYNVKNDTSIGAAETLEVRGILTITIVDLTGTAVFQRGDLIVVSDSVTGTFYAGYIQSDQQTKYGPASAAVDHVLTCYDKQYLLDKGANTTNYLGWYAGDIATDLVLNGQPGLEGVTVAAGLHRDSLPSEWSTGLLSGVVGASNVGDGDLELSPAGSDVSYSETTTSDFATGTLTNCVAANNTLTPTSTSAIKMVAVQSLAGNISNTQIVVQIWSGPFAISSTARWLEYDMFIDPASPQAKMAIDLYFSDGSTFSATSTVLQGNVDAQNITPDPANDLTGLATVGWYHRLLDLGNSHIGKTVTSAVVVCAGTSPGVYTGYFKNIIITDQTTTYVTIFASSLVTNPPQQLQSYGYSSANVSVVPTYDLYSLTAVDTYGASAYKTTSAISIDPVKLYRTSFLSWAAIIPTNCVLVVKWSLDRSSFIPCVNGAALPDFPAGLVVSGMSLYLKYEFYYLPGALPDSLIALEEVALTLYTSYAATKSDVSYSALTQANWNAGTLTNLVANSSNELTLNGIIRYWDDGSVVNQTLYSAFGGIQQGVTNRTFDFEGFSTANTEARSRFDFVGQWQNFTAEVDIQLTPADPVQRGLVYRTTGWQNNAGSAAYYVWVTTIFVGFGKGTNSSSGGATTQTLLAAAHPTYTSGSWHRLKVVVSGNTHNIYVDNILLISTTDSTYSATGYMGVFATDGGSSVSGGYAPLFDNFGVAATLSGTWVSPGTSLASAVNYGNSVIKWRDKSPSYNGLTNTSILVEASYDNGSTYHTCTNGAALPSLTLGQSLSSATLKIRVTLTTSSASSLPAIDNLVVRVLGQYSASGTRSTAPMGIDTMIRANQSGFGTAFDGQTYTKTGTGTDAIASNEATITNTTGDVHERLGSRTGTDLDGTVRLVLSASTISGGIELRYFDSNNYYRLSASTTSLSIIKKQAGAASTLATAAVALSTGVLYRLRFRVTGTGMNSLYGRIWADGSLEPSTWTIATTD